MKQNLPIKLNFNNNFFKEEVICNFKVSNKLKKIWAIELDLYKEFERVCVENKIKFCAFAGTLLGAVRHKGFIPWDDDFDVCMDRENFDRFIKLENEFKHPYFLQHALNDRKYFFGYARLRNSETTGAIRWNYSKNYNNGIYIDIYVLDGYLVNGLKFYLQLLLKKFFSIILYNYYATISEKDNIKDKMLVIFVKIFKLIKYENFVNLYGKIMSMNTKFTEKLTLMTHLLKQLRKYWLFKTDFDEIIDVQYENITIKIPKNYDHILSNMYGEYMKFPPSNDRGEWHNNIIYFDPDVPYNKNILFN